MRIDRACRDRWRANLRGARTATMPVQTLLALLDRVDELEREADWRAHREHGVWPQMTDADLVGIVFDAALSNWNPPDFPRELPDEPPAPFQAWGSATRAVCRVAIDRLSLGDVGDLVSWLGAHVTPARPVTIRRWTADGGVEIHDGTWTCTAPELRKAIDLLQKAQGT